MPTLVEAFAGSGSAVIRVSFNDEYRRPNSPHGEGLYLGLQVMRGPANEVWKLDLWGWDSLRLEQKLDEHRSLAEELRSADRRLVLEIKEAVHRRPAYRDTLTAMHVYRFALAEAGRTVADSTGSSLQIGNSRPAASNLSHPAIRPPGACVYRAA